MHTSGSPLNSGICRLTWIELIIGLALLLGGGEALVKGSVSVATRLGVSQLMIGLTLVGFGTFAVRERAVAHRRPIVNV